MTGTESDTSAVPIEVSGCIITLMIEVNHIRTSMVQLCHLRYVCIHGLTALKLKTNKLTVAPFCNWPWQTVGGSNRWMEVHVTSGMENSLPCLFRDNIVHLPHPSHQALPLKSRAIPHTIKWNGNMRNWTQMHVPEHTSLVLWSTGMCHH